MNTGGFASPGPVRMFGESEHVIPNAVTVLLKAFDAAMVDKYKRFLPVAQAFAQMSKYEGTRVGAVILGEGYEVRSSGWNGAPRGCKADVDSRVDLRDERLLWASHAEANAITNAARSGTALEGCTMVVTHTPCMACAKLIVQAGIKRVLCPADDSELAARWAEDFIRTKALFKECHVELVEV